MPNASDPSRQPPVLVTGGGGFVGDAIARALVAGGRRVRVLDVRPPKKPLPGVDYAQGSILDAKLVGECVSGAGVVVHAAAEVGVNRYVDDPEAVLDANIVGTRAVLRAAFDAGAKVLFTSSSEIYGKNPEPLGEDSDGVFGSMANSRWSYALSKAVGEQYLHALGRRGLRFVVARLFNAYGPLIDDPTRPNHGRVISKFIGCLREGRPLALVDGGRAVRSFTYIDDVVEALCLLLSSLETGGPVVGRAFNVGNSQPETIRGLAQRMIRLSGRNVGTVDVPGERFFGDGFEEIPHRVPDVGAMERAVGFRATIDLEEGLKRTLRHWRLLDPDALPAPAPELLPAIRPLLPAGAEVVGRIRSALLSGRVTNDGEIVRRFEQDAAAWLGASEAIAVGSGTAALQLAFAATGKKDGVVVLPSFTYIATLAGFSHFGLQPVFCDIEPDTWTLSPTHLKRLLAEQKALGRPVAAVVPVNVFGVPPDLARVAELAKEAGAALVYDNAHGMGTVQDGRRLPVGPLVQAFSLHATKVLPAVEGGLLVTEDASFAAELRRLRGHGLAANLLDSTPGFNARMNELCAAVASRSLANLEVNVEHRRAYAERLRATLSTLSGFTVQAIPEGVRSNFQNLGVLCDRPDAVEVFAAHGVQARRYFHPALHLLNRHADAPALPVTEHVASRILCLPLYDRMSEEQLERVEAAARAVR